MNHGYNSRFMRVPARSIRAKAGLPARLARSQIDSAAKPPPRQARSRAKLERLLAAGELLAARQGFERLRLADVARAAGCSVGVLYQRFPDKDAFVVALRDRFCAAMAERIARDRDSAALAALAPDALVRRVVANMVAVYRAREGFLRAMSQRAADDPAFWRPVREVARGVGLALGQGLAGCIDRRRHPDPVRAVRVALQAVNGTLMNEIVNRPGPLKLRDKALVDELARMAAAYLGLEPTAILMKTP